MTVTIYENVSNGRTWKHSITEETLYLNVKSYEIFDYDKEFESIILIDIAVKFLFGDSFKFLRDLSVREYIIGNIYNDNEIIYENVVIFIE